MASNSPTYDRRRLWIGILVLAIFAVVLLAYYFYTNCDSLPGMGECQRVLFIGNSYTYVNDLPGVFSALARSGGHRVKAVVAASGGWTLANHAASSTTLNQISHSIWDTVILQEQSEIPALIGLRTTSMYPAASQLVGLIEKSGAKPLLFITWAHRDGLPGNGYPDYQSMQAQIDQGYLSVAHDLKVGVVPAGFAWLSATSQDHSLGLWESDGSHPSVEGTYLAACVFYASIFHESPQGLSYVDNLPAGVASELQAISAEVVLANPEQWEQP